MIHDGEGVVTAHVLTFNDTSVLQAASVRFMRAFCDDSPSRLYEAMRSMTRREGSAPAPSFESVIGSQQMTSMQLW
jgi:hypothetical protein